MDFPICPLSHGTAPPGPVYVTLGNHDHYSGIRVDEFAEQFDRRKVTLLLNQVTFIRVATGELAIVGLDDPSLHRADLRCMPSAQPGVSPWCWPTRPTFWTSCGLSTTPI